VHFLLRSYEHFGNQYEEGFFISPVDLIKEIKFSSRRRELKKVKYE